MNTVSHYSFSGIEVRVFIKDKGCKTYTPFTNTEILKGQRIKVDVKNNNNEPIIANVAMDRGLHQGLAHRIKKDKIKEFEFKIIETTLFEDFRLNILHDQNYDENSFTLDFELDEKEEEEGEKEKQNFVFEERHRKQIPLNGEKIQTSCEMAPIGSKRKRDSSNEMKSSKARKQEEEKSPQESLMANVLKQVKHCVHYFISQETNLPSCNLDESTVLDESFTEFFEWTLLDGSPLKAE